MVENGLRVGASPSPRPGARAAGRSATGGPSDSLLVESTRSGDANAFLDLWSRHSRAVALVAARLTPPGERPGAVVNDAFAAVLTDITLDRDPAGPFRVLAYKAVLRLVGRTDLDEPVPLVRALGHLPSRAQSVLWYRDVEGLSEAEVALLVGEGPVEQRTVRRQALLALRAEWAIEKVMDPAVSDMCAWSATRLRARAAGWLTPSALQRFDRHVASCADCTEFVEQVGDLPATLRATVRGVLGEV